MLKYSVTNYVSIYTVFGLSLVIKWTIMCFWKLSDLPLAWNFVDKAVIRNNDENIWKLIVVENSANPLTHL